MTHQREDVTDQEIRYKQPQKPHNKLSSGPGVVLVSEDRGRKGKGRGGETCSVRLRPS